jgi:succinate dehydrogenase/fumarate reductase cytochrome b subunit (b558 family)
MTDHPLPVSIHHVSRWHFLLRRLHSLTGIVPVGVFVVAHLWTSSQALWGRARYDEAIRESQGVPYLVVLELLLLATLTFHAVYGVVLSLQARPNVVRYPFNRNWMYVAQRATGIVTFAFVAWHFSQTTLKKWQGELAPADFYPALCAELSSTYAGVPLAAWAYVLGIAASVFHLTNGLWGFGVSWGITVSQRSQRLSATVLGLVGLVVFLVGANTAIYFATGSRVAVLGAPREGSPVALDTCAAPFGAERRP